MVKKVNDQLNIPINKIENPLIINTDENWTIAINGSSLIDTLKKMHFSSSFKAQKLNIIGLVNVTNILILQSNKYLKLIPSEIVCYD